ncbi:glycerol-3-phosphate dehydrogenase [Malassezia yamatoensis]|uniref:Glycerol-3-phosphate dehydrogenase n=1 Tax=Malassezia yamatoensis TaxID=253288 RepID=A0AAJ5Z2G7_9BASI|nr:glycerol-3-phosphate dehydrogenase [Malassezia yamatoensis]
MLRPTLARLSQGPNAVSGTSKIFSRRPGGRTALVVAAAFTGAMATFMMMPSPPDEDGTSQDVRPNTHWSPPTRAQMIEALKKSSASSLRHDGTLDHARSLLRPQHRAQGSSPIPEVEHAYNHPDDSEEDGYDLLIVGGGATGAGCALDAVTRGLKVAVVERDDFSAGTSSKSTKLVHGGVRYLQKAIMQLDYEQYKMVREALHERKTFLYTAPYLSHPLPIMIPVYSWWKLPYYFAGTKMYDLIAGSQNMGGSYMVGRKKALELFPMLRSDKLAGGVVYYDGQQNDTRMNIALVLSAVQHGATAANHCEVVALNKQTDDQGKETIVGARLRDRLNNEEFEVKAKGVINATGPFCDSIRKLDQPTAQEIVAPSSGVHITFPSYFSPRNMGLLDPATSDGRVIFFLPWEGATIAGTTDTAAKVETNPVPGEQEIQWILDEVRNYMNADVTVKRSDVLSAWSGLRPLVKDPNAVDTQGLVRNHLIDVSESGLLTISGGKWTTYREMAEQTIDRAVEEYKLKPLRKCVTTQVRLLGSHDWTPTMYVRLLQEFGLELDVAKHLSSSYGDRAWSVCAVANPTGKRFPLNGIRLHPLLPYIEAEVRYATRMEYAVKAVDFIARRSRMSFLDTEATIECLPRVIDLMGEELDWSESRRQLEFEESLHFLTSMGVDRGRVGQLVQTPMADARRWNQSDLTRHVKVQPVSTQTGPLRT